jgi:hypothetical protein
VLAANEFESTDDRTRFLVKLSIQPVDEFVGLQLTDKTIIEQVFGGCSFASGLRGSSSSSTGRIASTVGLGALGLTSVTAEKNPEQIYRKPSLANSSQRFRSNCRVSMTPVELPRDA